MNINSKTIFYWIIIIIGLTTTLLTLNIIRSRNKYPSTTSIKNILTLYINKFYNLYNPNKNIDRVKYIKSISKLNKKLSIKENMTMYTYPFEIQFEEDTNKAFDLNFNQTHNILFIKNIDSLSEEEYSESLFKDFFSKFALSINYSLNANETLVNIKNNLPIYRCVNIYIWIPNTEMKKTNKYESYIDKILQERRMLQKIGPIVTKFIIYNSTNGVSNNKDLYTDVKLLNPKRLFNELNDEDLFNIHLLNEQKPKINTYFNEDLNSFIFGLDFDKHLEKKVFGFIIKYMQFLNLFTKKQKLLSAPYMTNHIFNELIKLFTHKENLRHLKFLAAMNNIEKISRIFPLYETILTVNKVKEKIEKILDFLKNTIKSNFDDISLENIDEIYVDTLYLMNSNELVIFEHFFSNEFKLGQFLPVMAPIFYALFQSIKSLTY
jgi:hypothetical protein